MSPEERVRPGPGPPPLLAFVRALPLAPALRPCPVAVAPSDASSSEGLEAGRLPGSISPFIYNPTRVRPDLWPGLRGAFPQALHPMILLRCTGHAGEGEGARGRRDLRGSCGHVGGRRAGKRGGANQQPHRKRHEGAQQGLCCQLTQLPEALSSCSLVDRWRS